MEVTEILKSYDENDVDSLKRIYKEFKEKLSCYDFHKSENGK